MNNIFGCTKIIIENNFPERQSRRTLKSLTKEVSLTEKERGAGNPGSLITALTSVLDDISRVLWNPRNGLGKSKLSSFCNRKSSAYKHQTPECMRVKQNSDSRFEPQIHLYCS